jgi:hypothetical protein
MAQWLGNASLWVDELRLAENVLGHGFRELLSQGLELGQVAPVGFMVLVRTAAMLFGDGELALRVVPLLASGLALAFFAPLAKDLAGPVGGFVATAMFALNPYLISMSGVVKQYSTDVLVTVVLMVILRRLWQGREPRRRRVLLLAVGAGALGTLSIPSAIVAASALIALFVQTWRRRATGGPDQLRSALFPIFAWGLAATAAAVWANALLTPSMRDYMSSYWGQAGAFMPPFFEYPTWMIERTSWILRRWALRPYIGNGGSVNPGLDLLASVPMVATVSCAAAVVLARKHGLGLGLFAVLPLVFSLGLSRLHLYPVDARTSLFLIPFVLLFWGISVGFLIENIPERFGWFRATVPVGAVILLGVALSYQHPVFRLQPTRELIRELSVRRGPDDPVFAFSSSWPGLLYYGRRFGVTDGIHGGPKRDLRSVLTQLNELKGERRLWVVVGHGPERDGEVVLCFLNEIGLEIDRIVRSGGLPEFPLSLHLFDVSDPALWGQADAETYPVTAEGLKEVDPPCRSGTVRDPGSQA